MELEEMEEACYFLKELGMSFNEIAEKLEIGVGRAKRNYKSYLKKIPEIDKADFETSRKFWSDLAKEDEGNVKVTLVDQFGRFYHGRKEDLQKMETEKLMQILFTNRTYLEKNPVGGFLDAKVAPGYDPMAPLRDVKKSTRMIEEILLKREETGSEKRDKESHKPSQRDSKKHRSLSFSNSNIAKERNSKQGRGLPRRSVAKIKENE